MSITLYSFRGKLYDDEEQFMANVQYRLFKESVTAIWGELIPIEDKPFCAGSVYIMELQNNRKIKCCLQSCSHRPVSMPARYVYRFTGTYPILNN